MICTLKKLEDRFVVVCAKQGEDCDSVIVEQFELPEDYPDTDLVEGKKIDFEPNNLSYRVVNQHILHVIKKYNKNDKL